MRLWRAVYSNCHIRDICHGNRNPKTSGHIVSAVRRQGNECWAPLALSFYSVGSQPTRYATHIQVGSSTSVKLSGNVFADTPRSISKVILNLVNLTVKINYHTTQMWNIVLQNKKALEILMAAQEYTVYILWYTVHILCIHHACTVYILCIYHDILYIYHVYTMYILCMYHVYTV